LILIFFNFRKESSVKPPSTNTLNVKLISSIVKDTINKNSTPKKVNEIKDAKKNSIKRINTIIPSEKQNTPTQKPLKSKDKNNLYIIIRILHSNYRIAISFNTK
jgi:hypothetical protein